MISPLSTDPRQQVPPPTRLAAMREVAALAGTTGARPWPRARSGPGCARPSGCSRVRRTASRSRPRSTTIERSYGADTVSLGGWHGDWGRWNMGMDGGVLQLWDWERYDTEVPIGFDALHFIAQGVRPGEREARRQEESFLRSVPEALAGARRRRRPARPHPPPLPARDGSPLRRRADPRCDACLAAAHLLGAVAAGAALRPSAQPDLFERTTMTVRAALPRPLKIAGRAVSVQVGSATAAGGSSRRSSSWARSARVPRRSSGHSCRTR